MLVQITNGTYGHRPMLPNGRLSEYVVPTNRFDPPIEVADEEAERLIALGIAVCAAPAEADATADGPEDDSPAESTPGEENDQNGSDGQENESEESVFVFSTEMKASELRAAMQERGLNIHVGMTKREMVEALNGGSDAPVLEVEGVIDE